MQSAGVNSKVVVAVRGLFAAAVAKVALLGDSRVGGRWSMLLVMI